METYRKVWLENKTNQKYKAVITLLTYVLIFLELVAFTVCDWNLRSTLIMLAYCENDDGDDDDIKKTTTKPSINKNTDLFKHTNVTFWHWCRTIQLNLIMYTHRAILRGVFLPVSKPHPHSANLPSSFSQRCLHREMVREMGLMESNSILRQIHISQQLMDWLMGLRLHFLREDLYQKQ